VGRKRVVLTLEEIAARKQKYWGPERNAKRRAKYAEDATHRASIIQQVRESYRAKRRQEGRTVREEDCRENIKALPYLGEIREVTAPDGQKFLALTLTVDELANALNRSPQVLYRWMGDGLLPEPLVAARNSRNREQRVYLAPEVGARRP
jgi:hypothetical protein